MRLVARYFWVLLVTITLLSCKGNEADCNCSNIKAPGPVGFEVPANADIQMYEVNMRAFSAEGTFKG
ncbi:MAG: hypothetical protein ACOVMN_05210, partial [Flexibacteraceae bacterium]